DPARGHRSVFQLRSVPCGDRRAEGVLAAERLRYAPEGAPPHGGVRGKVALFSPFDGELTGAVADDDKSRQLGAGKSRARTVRATQTVYRPRLFRGGEGALREQPRKTFVRREVTWQFLDRSPSGSIISFPSSPSAES